MGDAAEVAAFHKEKLKRLSEQSNTTVYTVSHDTVADAWPVQRVRAVLESIATRLQTEFRGSDVSDFTVRKTCLSDPEVLAFQRQHPKLYWMVTDREKMKESKYRAVIAALLEVRSRVEKGHIADGEEADAAATRTVIDALQ